MAFANGCFDLLHVGHIRYLAAAAQEADLLVVAINDDESVRTLKGRGGPILAAARSRRAGRRARAASITSSSFPEPTVGPLLEALRPDVHCKGTDYTLDSVPERDVVRGYGGRIAIVGDPKDHSTRDLLARIAESVPVSHSFLLVRLGSLGDVIHAIPTAAALRARFPEARIDWMVDPRYVALLEMVRGIDSRIAVEPAAACSDAALTLGDLRGVGYTAVIDLQGLLKSAVLARAVAG